MPNVPVPSTRVTLAAISVRPSAANITPARVDDASSSALRTRGAQVDDVDEPRRRFERAARSLRGEPGAVRRERERRHGPAHAAAIELQRLAHRIERVHVDSADSAERDEARRGDRKRERELPRRVRRGKHAHEAAVARAVDARAPIVADADELAVGRERGKRPRTAIRIDLAAVDAPDAREARRQRHLACAGLCASRHGDPHERQRGERTAAPPSRGERAAHVGRRAHTAIGALIEPCA